jgi:glycosyltransferase involved in cell wall biosynthesis
MACGRPVVQPAKGCFPELIEQSSGGLLFEPSNIDDYCDKLLQILSDHDLRMQLGQNARGHVCTQRNSQSMGRSTAAVINQFLGADGGK